jgi:hypothetical protein
MADQPKQNPVEGRAHRRIDAGLEIATAIVLTLAALLTSWAAYQGSLWDGEQAANYTKANAQHMEAGRLSTRAGQLQALDAAMFGQWVNAYAEGKRGLQQFYEARFRPEFAEAFRDWQSRGALNNPAAPSSPFYDPEYRNVMQAQADAVERDASRLFETGEKDNSISDHYGQATVILASALFFGGMCQVFRTPKVRLALIAVAMIACVAGIAKIFVLPVLRL